MPESSAHWRITFMPPVKLDKIDYKLVSALHQNARVRISELAAITRLSKAGVINRINRLQESKVINGYKTHFSLFTPTFNYGLIRIQYAQKSNPEFNEKIASRPEVITVITLLGKYNALICIAYRNQLEKNEFIQSLKEVARELEWIEIRDFWTMPFDYTRTYIELPLKRNQHQLTPSKKTSQHPSSSFSSQEIKIMLELHQDPRIPISVISEHTGIGKTICKKIAEKLVEQGTITKFSANVNPYAFDAIKYCILWVKTDGDKSLQALREHLATKKLSNGFAAIQGEWNALAFLHFHSNENIKDFEHELNSTAGVEDYYLELVREQAKLEWIPPLIMNYFTAIGKKDKPKTSTYNS